MIASSVRLVILPFLAGLFLAGCASSTMSRIDDNRAQYESWPIEVQEAVLNKRAVKGMTSEQVTMAMGKPTSVEVRGGKNNEDEEVWIYKSGGGGPLSNLPIDVGTGTNIGGVGIYTSKTINSGRPSQSEQDEVIFANGQVIRTDIAAR